MRIRDVVAYVESWIDGPDTVREATQADIDALMG